MMNELVGQFLKSSDGGSLLQDLVSKGLSEQQVTQAVTATAEGAKRRRGPRPGRTRWRAARRRRWKRRLGRAPGQHAGRRRGKCRGKRRGGGESAGRVDSPRLPVRRTEDRPRAGDGADGGDGRAPQAAGAHHRSRCGDGRCGDGQCAGWDARERGGVERERGGRAAVVAVALSHEASSTGTEQAWHEDLRGEVRAPGRSGKRAPRGAVRGPSGRAAPRP